MLHLSTLWLSELVSVYLIVWVSMNTVTHRINCISELDMDKEFSDPQRTVTAQILIITSSAQEDSTIYLFNHRL